MVHGVGWRTTTDIDAFLAAAGEAMRARPAQHTLLLTITESLRIRGSDAYGTATPCFGWHGAVDGTFLHTPPYPLVLGPAPEAAMPALAAALGDRPLPGVSAPTRLGEAFASARGGRVRLKRQERLYRLGTLTPPAEPPPGRAVVATPAMRDRLIDFYVAFAGETGEPSDRSAGMVDDRLSHGGLMVWENPDGEIAGMASGNRMIARRPRWTRARATCCCSPTWRIRRATASTNGSATSPSRIGCRWSSRTGRRSSSAVRGGADERQRPH
jgi:hypothetical protein